MTLIAAIFPGLAEIAATVALPQVELAIQATFVWFVMGFPTLLVLLFFATLNFNPPVLYAPGDYRDDSTFERMIRTTRYVERPSVPVLHDAVLKLDGTVDQAAVARIREWMNGRGLESVTLAMFLNDATYERLRAAAAADLGFEKAE